MDESALERIRDRLRSAQRVLFITGAGLSADSGLPTYRGVGGLYEDDDEVEEGMSIEEALSGPMLVRRPDVAWRHISRIEKSCRGASPNRGHAVMAELEARFEVVVLTQNVDGFHRQAGSTKVIDIHGDVHHLRCTECSWKDDVTDYADLQPVPLCPKCLSLVRPDVVLFEEMLPPRKLLLLQAEVSAGFDVVFSVGTSSLFAYIAAPVAELRAQGALTVEINPAPSAVSGVVDIVLRARAAPTLETIARSL